METTAILEYGKTNNTNEKTTKGDQIMEGYFKCEKCNSVIDVITSSRSAKRYSIKVKIPKCPQCNGKIKEIEYEDFNKAKPKTFLRLGRTFNFKHIGDRVIKMRVKFL